MKIGGINIVNRKIGGVQINEVRLGNVLIWTFSNLLLDRFPNASAAYALHKLRKNYSGSSVRVRRASDNVEQNIGFVNNELDTVSLLSFVGSGDAFVVTRYDQSGEGLDLSQSSASLQPKIVSSGALILEGGKPMIDYDGISNVMETASGINLQALSRSSFMVQKSDTVGVKTRLNLASGGGTGSVWLISPELAVRANSVTWVSNTPTSTVDVSLITNVYVGGNITTGNAMWLNGESVARASGSGGSIFTNDSSIQEGGREFATGNLFYDGKVDLTVIYKFDQTANRSAIETNINDYYSIYQSGFLLKEDGDNLLLETDDKIIL